MILRCAVLLLSLAAFAVPSSALANGVDLARFAGKPGEEVAASGHLWLTPCCPSVAYERVRLFLLDGADRIELFSEAPDETGSVFASFEVPDVRPGVYPLQPCGDSGDGAEDCRAPTPFQVLAGGGGGGGGSLVTLALVAALLLAVSGGGLLVVYLARRRS